MNGVDVLAVREQLLLLGHNVADDMIVSFLKGLNLDGCLGACLAPPAPGACLALGAFTDDLTMPCRPCLDADALDTDPAHDLAVDYPQQAGAPHYEAQQAAGSDGDDLGSPSEDDRGGRAAGQALRKCQPVAQQEVHVSHAQGPRLQPLKAGVNMLLPGSSSGRFAGMLGALAAAPGMPGDRPDVSPLRDCAQDQSSPAGKPLAKPYASDATASRLDDLAACGSDDGDDDAEEPLGLDMRCRSFLSRLAERRSAHGGGEALPPSAHDADFTCAASRHDDLAAYACACCIAQLANQPHFPVVQQPASFPFAFCAATAAQTAMIAAMSPMAAAAGMAARRSIHAQQLAAWAWLLTRPPRRAALLPHSSTRSAARLRGGQPVLAPPAAPAAMLTRAAAAPTARQEVRRRWQRLRQRTM